MEHTAGSAAMSAFLSVIQPAQPVSLIINHEITPKLRRTKIAVQILWNHSAITGTCWGVDRLSCSG